MSHSHPSANPSPIQVAELADGRLLYVVQGTPADLPVVRKRDLLAAWDAARHVARHGHWGSLRLFRFVSGDGAVDVALTDADARSWAEAVDARTGLQTRYGLSLCLRLLALVDLITRAPASRHLISFDAGEAELHPGLVSAAASATLNEDARFDAPALLAGLRPAWQALPRPTGTR